jgi:hypothetical protein
MTCHQNDGTSECAKLTAEAQEIDTCTLRKKKKRWQELLNIFLFTLWFYSTISMSSNFVAKIK